MMRTVVAKLVIAAFGSILTVGVARAVDVIPAEGGNIEIIPIRHAHVQIEYGGKVIHVDPWAGPTTFSIPLPPGTKPADVILITDVHDDHLHQPSIDRVKKASTAYVIPKAVSASIRSNATIMENGESKVVEGVSVQAIAAYNLTRGGANGLYHVQGRANGYILTLGGKRIYFAADTECVPEIKALTNIDVAFIPVNLPFTMSGAEAADCVKAFKPKIVYPYHYQQQGVQPPNKHQLDFATAMKDTPGIEVRIVDFYSRAP